MKLLTLAPFFIYIFALSPPAAKAYPGLSPYQYCASDPINFTDPTGCIIQGITKKETYGSQLANSDCDVKNKEYNEFLSHHNFNDTILNIIDGRKFLYYATGHHGYSWAITQLILKNKGE